MKIYHQIIIFLSGTQLFSCAGITPNLDKIGETLGFPSDQMIIEDYLETERSIYTNQSAIEIGKNSPTPFRPERILQAYKITGKNPHSFLPIIITVVDKDTYESDSMKIVRSKFASIPEKLETEGGRLPHGNFKISDTDTGFFLIQEIRTPARPIYDESDPQGALKYVNKCPQTLMSNVSFLHVSNSNVDVRIAQYKMIEDYTKDFVTIPRGEKYFNRFGYLSTDDDGNQVGQAIKRIEPFHEMIIEVFKALNLEILESPMLNPFRKEQKIGSPIIVADSKKISPPIVAPPPEALPKEKPSEVTKPEPKDHSWRWLVGLLALLSVMGFAVKRYCSKRAVLR